MTHPAAKSAAPITGFLAAGNVPPAPPPSSPIINLGSLILYNGVNGAPGQTLGVTGVFENLGTVQVGTGGTGAAALLDIQSGGVFNNNATLTIDAHYAGSPGYGSHGSALTVAGALHNAGLLTIQGAYGYYGATGATGSVSGSLLNTGTLAIEGGFGGFYGSGYGTGGTLSVTGALFNHGELSVGGGGAAYRAGTGGPGVLVDAGILRNAGTISLAGGAGYNLGGDLSSPAGAQFTVSGTLATNGLITIGNDAGNYSPGHGATLTDSGTLLNAGSIVLQGAQGFAYYTSTGAGSLQDSGALVNSGVITLGAGGGTSSGATLTVSGRLLNAGSIVADNATSSNAGGGVLSVTSTGTLTNTGAITLLANATFQGYVSTLNAGRAAIAGHLLNLGVVQLQGGGGYYGSLGAQVSVSGTLTNAGSLGIGGGTGGFYGSGNGTGATLAVTGQLTNLAQLSVAAGGPSFRSSDGTPGVLLDQGSVTNSGTIALSGSYGYYSGDGVSTPPGAQLTITGNLVNTGQIFAGGDIGYFSSGFGATITDNGVLTNNATLTAAAGQNLAFHYSNSGAHIDVGGTLVNNDLITLGAANGNGSAATLAVTGTLINNGTITGGGVVTNTGQIEAGAGSGAIAAALVNDGTVQVGAGAAMTIAGPVSATAGGAWLVAAGGALTFQGAVEGQTIDIAAGGDVRLADAADFHAALGSLGAGATIDLMGLQADAASVHGHSLDIALATGQDLAFSLGADFGAAPPISLAADGHGGTDLVFGPGS